MIFALVASLIFSAFFSGLEIAFLTSNKLRIELLSNQGVKWAKLSSNFLKNPSKYISTILVGNNIALVIYGLFMEELIRPTFSDLFSPLSVNASLLSLVVATLISTSLVVVFGEFIPKALFKLNPSAILSVLIFPFQLMYWLLFPVVQIIIFISQLFLRNLGASGHIQSGNTFTKVDLDHFVEQALAGASEADEKDNTSEFFKNALDFENVCVRDCLIPRTELAALEIESTIEELVAKFVETNHSKILIFDDNIDNIIGYVHHLDLYKKPMAIKDILNTIPITTESKPVHELLKEFSAAHKSIALVVDEYGGTSGIITVEDIMEEIFGEIEDEHDYEEPENEVQTQDGSYIFSAKLEIDYLNEKYELEIPEGDYETLGGFIVAELEEIPKAGDIFNTESLEIKVIEASEKRIEKVALKRKATMEVE